MGLDMYLEEKFYLSNYPHSAGSKQYWTANAILDLLGVRAYQASDSAGVEVSYKRAYWRKANAIHGWFVDNLADGVDECQDIEVGVNDLKLLVNRCQDILKAKDEGRDWQALAVTILPAREGFFFGSTEYGDWYLSDLTDTIEMLKPIIEDYEQERDVSEPGRWLNYRASW